MPQEGMKPNNHNRNEIELLRYRIYLLDGQDKLLMVMYLENGNSFRQIARLLGVCHQTISRKINRLINNLTGEHFQIYKQNRKKFNKVQKVFARDYFLNGLSMRQIAIKHQCSYYRVRNIMAEIQNLIETNTNTFGPHNFYGK